MRKHTLLFVLMLFASAFAFGQTDQKPITELRTFIEEIRDGDYFTMVYSFKDGFGYDVMLKNNIIVSKKPKEGRGFASKEAALKDAREEVRLKKGKVSTSAN